MYSSPCFDSPTVAATGNGNDISDDPTTTPKQGPIFNIPSSDDALGGAGGAGVYAEIALFPTVAGGHDQYAECVMPAAYKAVLDWFEEVERADSAKGSSEGYANPRMDVAEEIRREREGEVVETTW